MYDHFVMDGIMVVHDFSITVFYNFLVATKNRFSSGSLEVHYSTSTGLHNSLVTSENKLPFTLGPVVHYSTTSVFHNFVVKHFFLRVYFPTFMRHFLV